MRTRVVSVAGFLVAPRRANALRVTACDAEAALSHAQAQLVRKETLTVLGTAAFILTWPVPARATA